MWSGITHGPSIQLILEDTVHKGASKRHKTDEKEPILWCMFFHKYSDYFF